MEALRLQELQKTEKLSEKQEKVMKEGFRILKKVRHAKSIGGKGGRLAMEALRLKLLGRTEKLTATQEKFVEKELQKLRKNIASKKKSGAKGGSSCSRSYPRHTMTNFKCRSKSCQKHFTHSLTVFLHSKSYQCKMRCKICGFNNYVGLRNYPTDCRIAVDLYLKAQEKN